MDRVALFRKVVLGAAVATLDVAGTALLPVGWPILRGALTPVLDRLSQRLGGKDVTSSPELAERAAFEFEHDNGLQELFQTSLLDALDPVVKGQQKIHDDVRMLCEVAMANTKALAEIKDEVVAVGDRLAGGVDLTEETMEKLCNMISSRRDVAERTRNFARAQLAARPPADLTRISRDQIKAQVADLEIAAIELIDTGQFDRALQHLNDVEVVLASALEETPTDVTLKVLQGYMFKTMAQAFLKVGRGDIAGRYIELAETAFSLVAEDIPADQKTLSDAAGAINGLGNVYALMEEYDKAILSYKRATTLLPHYAYSWHDLFAAYDALARRGELHLEEMRQAYLRLRETAGAGLPGLSPEYLAGIEKGMRYWEQSS